MNWGEVLRREWGAVTFIIAVLIGMVIVPLTLALNGPRATATPLLLESPTPSVVAASPSASTSPLASGSPVISPSAAVTPAASGAPSPAAGPTPSVTPS